MVRLMMLIMMNNDFLSTDNLYQVEMKKRLTMLKLI